MRDLLRNTFPRNPTQTAYLRFMRVPGGELKSKFTEAQDLYSKMNKDLLKTYYTKRADALRRELAE